MSERIYRDSVHNIIRLKTDNDEGKLLIDLVDTPEFQRLRRIRQLGLAYFAYQSAEHSRFTHSLGTLHLVTRILAKLDISYDLSPESKTAVKAAALLHDIGHGPFSHVIEPVFGFHHEDFTIETVLSPDTGVGQALRAYSENLPSHVAEIIRGTFKPMALTQLVSSQLDVDRMDYLLRDSLMTGAKYGIFDLEWIIKSLEINEEADHLYVAGNGIYAVEDYLQARYYMFRQVYFHRTLRAAESVLRSLIRRAADLFLDGEKIWLSEGGGLEKILKGGRLSLAEHLEMDDNDVVFHIKRWASSNDGILSDLARRFIDRRLFKAFDLDMPEAERIEFLARARAIVESAGFDTSYYLIEDMAGEGPYHFYIRGEAGSKDLIYVEEGYSRARIREISEVSPSVRGLQDGYQIHRVCFPAELKNDIEKLYHET